MPIKKIKTRTNKLSLKKEHPKIDKGKSAVKVTKKTVRKYYSVGKEKQLPVSQVARPKAARLGKKVKSTIKPAAAPQIKSRKNITIKPAASTRQAGLVAESKPADISPDINKVKIVSSTAPAIQQVSAPGDRTPLRPSTVVARPAQQAVVKPKPQIVLPKEEKSSTGLQEIIKKIEPAKDTAIPAVPKQEEAKVIEIEIPVVLKDLAASLQEKPAVLIRMLLEYKILANINQPLDEELAKKIASQYGYQIKKKPSEEELIFGEYELQDPASLKPRPPIVTFMGHVDHGKTSLLDAIRKSKVADTEYGGITQHIGAYEVSLPAGQITFLDTPGHEAFTAMRSRGAKVTDIVVLVVAADDGVMPQTIEAIDHARDAGVPIIVAINKIDKPQVNIDLIKKELSKLGLAAEDWGGKTITVGVSAKTGQGIDELLEMILLEAEMLELKASPTRLAKGVVLEAKITEGRGMVATLLVEDGTLYPKDIIIAGSHYAKIRAMFNEFGKQTKEALPSTPVEVLGLSGLPAAGEQFFALADEKKAKELAAKRREQFREKELRPMKMMSLEDFSIQIKEGKVKELKLILKADVGGSLEAINESLKKLENSEVKLKIIHQGVGNINVSDVVLACASGAIILGFHVSCDERSREEVNKSGIDIRTYNVIYELYNDLKTALEGLLEPKLKKVFLGRLAVRQVFKLSKAGVVAGCYVEKGKINRLAKLTVLRNAGVVFEGTISSLKRFKDDVREVTEGMECGVSLSSFDDIMPGDIIEAYDIEKIVRKL